MFIKGTKFNLIYSKKKKDIKQVQYALIFLLSFYSWHMWKKYQETKEHNENFETCALDSADAQICFFGALSKAQAACSDLDRMLWAQTCTVSLDYYLKKDPRELVFDVIAIVECVIS